MEALKVVFVLVFVGVSFASAAPDFCNGLDCPDFKIINKTQDYEYRMYSPSKWISTSLTGVDYSRAQYQMFMKLFNYISGANDKGEKIAMTAPVINRIIPGPGAACESNFTMSFFLSPNVTNPPAPTDNTVFLDNIPADKVYVRSYGGFSTEQTMVEQAAKLHSSLPPTAKYHTMFYYTAGYDSPFKFFNRHNEIWFIGE